jgi:hypothetical protein
VSSHCGFFIKDDGYFINSLMAISSSTPSKYVNVYNRVLCPNFHTTVLGQHGIMIKEIIPEPKIQWCLVEHWINSTFPLLLFNIAFGMWMSKIYQPFLRLSTLDLTELGRSICGTTFISGSDDTYVTFGLKPHNWCWSYLTILWLFRLNGCIQYVRSTGVWV